MAPQTSWTRIPPPARFRSRHAATHKRRLGDDDAGASTAGSNPPLRHKPWHSERLGGDGVGRALDEHLHDRLRERQPRPEHGVQRDPGVIAAQLPWRHLRIEDGDDVAVHPFCAVRHQAPLVHLPQRLEHVLHERRLLGRAAAARGLLRQRQDRLLLLLDVVRAPETPEQRGLGSAGFLGVQVGEAVDAEAPAVAGAGEDDVALVGMEGVALVLVFVHTAACAAAVVVLEEGGEVGSGAQCGVDGVDLGEDEDAAEARVGVLDRARGAGR